MFICRFQSNLVGQISAKQMFTDEIRDKWNLNSGNTKEKLHFKITCFIVPITNDPRILKKRYSCDKLVVPVISMQEGRKCVSYFSYIAGKSTRSFFQSPQIMLHYDRVPQIVVKVEGNFLNFSTVSNTGFGNIQKAFDENITSTTNDNESKAPIGAYISLHDPDILPYMHNIAFHQLVSGRFTVVPFVKRIQKLLPPPFATGCRKYNSKLNNHSRFDYQQFRTRGECMLHCNWNLLATTTNQNKCVNFFSMYTKHMIEEIEDAEKAKQLQSMIKENVNMFNSTIDIDTKGYFKICPRTENSFKDYIKAKVKCLKACPIDCTVNTFEDYRTIDTQYPTQINTSYVVFLWAAQQPVVEIVHHKKWEIFEFLGTIGGLIHFGFKLSIIYIIWYIITLIQTAQILPAVFCSPVIACGKDSN